MNGKLTSLAVMSEIINLTFLVKCVSSPPLLPMPHFLVWKIEPWFILVGLVARLK